jgi:hypothetical protein
VKLDLNDVAYGSKAAMKELQELQRTIKMLKFDLALVTEEREYYKAKLAWTNKHLGREEVEK